MDMNVTLEYYEKHAEGFVSGTKDVDFSEMQNHFLERLPTNPYILDFGCGSGRDTKYFLEHGCRVEATDGSEKLCEQASVFTGIQVKHMLFDELDEENVFDGIWACASILHLPKKELLPVLQKMTHALKCDGVIYTSFKYGEYEGERNGRYFTDFTEVMFEEYIRDHCNLAIEEYWITGDVRPGREEEKWLNLLLRKK